MRFEVLGLLRVTDGEQELPLGGSMQRKLLALLVAAGNQPISVDRLVDEMWGDEPPQSAAHLIQVYVSRLRGLLVFVDADVDVTEVTVRGSKPILREARR